MKKATAVKSTGSKVEVVSVAVIAMSIGADAAATAASHAPRVLAPIRWAKATTSGTSNTAASTAGKRKSQRCAPPTA